MSLPYSDIARSKGWTPRGWFGLTEPQQMAVLRAPATPQRAKSLGLFGTTLEDVYNPTPPPVTRLDAILQNEQRDAAEIARMQAEADAFAAGVHAREEAAQQAARARTAPSTAPRTVAPVTTTPRPTVPAPAPTTTAIVPVVPVAIVPVARVAPKDTPLAPWLMATGFLAAWYFLR